MILLGLVSMAIFVGMPKLMDNSKSSSTNNKLSRILMSVHDDADDMDHSGPGDAKGI